MPPYSKQKKTHTSSKTIKRVPTQGSDGFEAETFYVDPEIRKAESLPAEAFANPNFLNLELQTLFTRTWLLVPERSQHDLRDDPRAIGELVKLRGARSPFSLLNKPFFLQRDWKGKLHSFPNVCTHAWYPLVHGPTRERSITCGQHGRQFDCEGRFLAQTGFGDLKGFPRESDNLRNLPVEQWLQFIFVNLGRPMAPLRSFLGEMEESASRLLNQEFKRVTNVAEVREIPGNWKQYAWNYMDRFHIGYIHRAPGGLADAIDLPSYRTELYDFSSLQWVYARNPDHGFNPRELPERFRDPKAPGKRVFALWWFLFPNMTFNFYPWGLSVNVYMPVPGKPETTLFYWYHYVSNEEKYKLRNDIWLIEQVDNEDVDAMMQVQRGVRSGLAVRGRFAPQEETGPHWFHRLVYKTIFEA